jgi:signal transduction histidine kinase/CheY-like chemotaxis protein
MWLGILTIFGGAYGAYVLARRSFRLGSIWLVTVLALALSLMVLTFPSSSLRFFLALIPLAGTLIMSPSDTWISAALVLISLLGIETLAPHTAVGYGKVAASIGLGFLTYGLAVLLSRSLRTAAVWASEHQALAQQYAEEARNHRAELARAFKALDEAWHRLERMNNELIHARAEAEQARQLKAEFAAHVSHELRTPLNIILGFSRMMFLSPESYGGEPLPPAYRGDMQAVYRGSQHLSHLVDDILDLSRVEAGRMTISPQELNLSQDIIQETIQIVDSLAAAKGIELRVEIAEDLPPVHGDPVRLRQVLLNLVNNAIRFTDHGYVAVRATVAGQTVTVSVTDTGRGMATEDIEEAFEAFQQVWTPGETIEGTGLGLAISKLLIQLHGGRIWAESQIGEGTTVHFTLPMAKGHTPAGSESRTAKRWSRSSSERKDRHCLVVSPDPLTRQVLERHLLKGDSNVPKCKLIHIERAEEIRDAVEQLHPQAIIVDKSIGEDITQISAEFPYDVPIAVCSIPGEAEASLALGAVRHLRKPVKEEELLSAVEGLGSLVETVLIVDDDRWMVRLLSRMLGTASRPYRILEAFDGDEALTLMRQVLPDVVLLDILMHGKDGFEVLQEMKGDPDLADTPVIMVSGAGQPSAERACPSVFSVVRKGRLTIEQITAVLRAVLTSMPPDYLSYGTTAPEHPGAPVG